MQKHEIEFNMNNNTMKFILNHCEHVDFSFIERTITTKKSELLTLNKLINILRKNKLFKKKQLIKK